MTEYKASWSTRLIILTLVATAILFGISIFSYIQEKTINVIVWLTPLIWFIAALFTVRGYCIENNQLNIRRLLWETKIDLSNLKRVAFNPLAIQSSVRTFGNGGLFSFSGFFKNSILGTYRSYSTNYQNAVVLYFDSKTIVITPDNPVNFVSAITQFKNLS